MNTNIKTIANLTIITILFFSGVSAYAQTNAKNYTVLSPLPGTTLEKTCPATGCTANLETYLPGLFNWSIGIAAVMAFFMITFGGITYMTSDAITGKSQGKEYITNALYGLLLVIGAYVILYTINPKILKFDFKIEPLNIAEGPAPAVVTPGTGIINQSAHDNVLARLRAGKVDVNNNGKMCPAGQTTGCTSLNGLPENAIATLIRLKKECTVINCSIEVTGGTEAGHVTHGVGKPIVDLSPNSALNSFLARSNPLASNPTSGTRAENSYGIFTYENTGDFGKATAPHWHVVLK